MDTRYSRRTFAAKGSRACAAEKGSDCCCQFKDLACCDKELWVEYPEQREPVLNRQKSYFSALQQFNP